MEENLFRSIPRVDELLGRDELKVSALPPVLLRESVREELDALRDEWNRAQGIQHPPSTKC